VLLTMLLVRIIPARRLRELMAALGGILAILIYVGTQIWSRAADEIATAENVERLLRLDQPWLPTAWPARLLLGIGTGDAGAVARYGLLYLAATAGLFGLGIMLAERLYYQGWAKVASSSGGRSRARGPRTGRTPLLRGPAGAIFLKDIRMLPRDPQRLSQLLVPLAFSIFWVWQLVAGRGGRGVSGSGLLANLTGIALLVGVLIAGSIGLTGVSREGRGYWLLQLAPISPWSILRGKLALTFLPFPVIGTAFVVFAWLLRRPPPGLLLQAWVIVLLTGLGVSAITTGFGAAYPRFDWTQAQRMTTLRAGCLAPVAYYTYTALMLFVTIGVTRFTGRGGPLVLVAGWSAALLLTAVACAVPLSLASARLRRLEM
jgi:ABC-2 type transport system permease protein